MQEVTMTVQVPIDLRDAFLARVNQVKRPASQIILDLMRAFAVGKINNTEGIYILDRLCSDGIAGQAAILNEQLKAGFPLIYHDEQGNKVQKNPDGTITAIHIHSGPAMQDRYSPLDDLS